MENKWVIRAYREGDEGGIFELWKAVHPEETYVSEDWMKWWHWKYQENPAGKARIWLADHSGKIVGQYAIVPVAMKIGCENVVCAQSVDTMTHPDYRRQGMFETLAKAVYAEAEKEDTHIVYGFPNQFSYSGFLNNLNWFDIAPARIIFKPLSWQNALKAEIKNRVLLKISAIGGNLADIMFFRPKKSPVIEGLSITQTSRFDERVNHLWARVSGQHRIMVIRDNNYLNWRYVTAPGLEYTVYLAEKNGEILGYIVLRTLQREYRKVVAVLDILADSEQIAQSLVSQAIEHCKQEKADLIYCNIIANKTYIQAFKNNGFISVPFVKGAPFCAHSSSPDISKDFLKDAKNWFIQIGDSDIV